MSGPGPKHGGRMTTEPATRAQHAAPVNADQMPADQMPRQQPSGADNALAPHAGGRGPAVMPRIVAALGFRTAAPVASLRAALEAAETAAGVRANGLATAAAKAQALALTALALERGLPVLAITDLPADTPTQSPAALATYGTGSVAEAAALAAAGPAARLLTTRIVSTDGMATAAIATGDPA